MNLYDFLSHTDVQLPLTWSSHLDYEAFVRERLDGFVSLLGGLDSNPVVDAVKKRIDAVALCCEHLRTALRTSFEGHPHEAYQHFDQAMEAVLPEVEAQSLKAVGPNDLGMLYRVRQTPTPQLRRHDLFHIPFELRHLVSTQRYSIPGLPCLYLSGSLYTCWEEMGRPPLHELQCSGLWVKRDKSLKLLDFSNRPARLVLYAIPPGSCPTEATLQKFLSSQIVIWPLIAMSSVVVKHRASPFKPEYVIPQMVLQWVTRNHGFDGVVYFSTHVATVTKKHPLPACNLVLPAKEVGSKGRCPRLCGTFKMTEPYGWQLLSSIQVGEGSDGMLTPSYGFEFIEGIEEPYYKTEFGMVQMKLNKLATRIMTKNRKGDTILGDVAIT